MKNLKSDILYISFDGIMEPLGHSQVLKYIEKLSDDYSIHLISFEKEVDLKNIKLLKSTIKRCKNHHITWHRLKYRNGFFGFGQLINILSLGFFPLKILINRNIALVHIRSYMPGIFMPFLKNIFNFKLVFDMRGFWADEKHDRLNWSKKSFKFKFFKKLERILINNSDYVVTLTHASKDIICNNFMITSNTIKVIPTCVDFSEFRIIDRMAMPDSICIGYLGSVDTAYNFTRFCFLISQIKKNFAQSVKLKVLTNKTFEEVASMIPRNILLELELEVKFVQREKLAKEISSFDLLGFYLNKNFSINASMPTKIGECLACGVPIVCNPFNLDIKDLIKKNNIGLIYNFKDEITNQQLKILSDLIEEKYIEKRCAKVAEKYFALETGVSNYRDIYRELIS